MENYNMKTIRELANEIGVSKTAVRKKIENLGLSDLLQTNGNQFLVDSRQEAVIKSAFIKNESQTGNRKPVCEKTESLQLVSDMVSVLKDQLEVKDQQIKELSERLAESNAALVAAQQTARDAQALHAGTIQQLITEPEEEHDNVMKTEAEPDEHGSTDRKPWWKLW